jgi:hypothetical protein
MLAPSSSKEYLALKASGAKMPRKMMLEKKYPGVYPGCFTKSHWLGSMVSENWKLLCEQSPHLAKNKDYCPEWVRSSLGMKKGPGRFVNYPLDLCSLADTLLQIRLELGIETTRAGLTDLLTTLAEMYNEEIANVNKEIQRVNDTLHAHQEGFLQPAAKPMPLLETLNIAMSRPSMVKRADHFCRKYGLASFSQTKPSKHLPYTHPEMKKVRNHIRFLCGEPPESDEEQAGEEENKEPAKKKDAKPDEQLDKKEKEQKVDKRLLGNFDQVWTTMHEPASKILYRKNPDLKAKKPGETVDPLESNGFRKIMRAKLQEKAGIKARFCLHLYIHTYMHKLNSA